MFLANTLKTPQRNNTRAAVSTPSAQVLDTKYHHH